MASTDSSAEEAVEQEANRTAVAKAPMMGA